MGPVTRRSPFDELKAAAGKASLSRLCEHQTRLAELVSYGPTAQWLAHIPPAKISHFAGEARALDASEMADVGDTKRLALLVCLVHVSTVRARDELVTMLRRRVGKLHQRAREELEAIRRRERAETERLWAVL